MLELIRTNQFVKDAKLQKKRGKKLEKLYTVIEKLCKEEKLEAKYKEHKLIGEYKDWMECHIEPDWLLIYVSNDKELTLARTGTHSDLFE